MYFLVHCLCRFVVKLLQPFIFGFVAKLHCSTSVETLLILLLHHEVKTFVVFGHLSEPLLEGSPTKLGAHVAAQSPHRWDFLQTRSGELSLCSALWFDLFY